MAVEYTADGGANPGFYISPNASSGVLEISASGTPCNAQYARPSAAVWHHYFVTIDRNQGGASGIKLYLDGVLQTALSSAGSGNAGNFANSSLFLLCRNNVSLFGAGRLQNVILRGGYVGNATEAYAEYQNTWQLFAKPSSTIWVPVSAGGGVTGTLSATEANDTISAAATLALAASLAKTDAGDTVTSAAAVGVTATSSTTDAGDTSTASATVGVTATSSTTDAGDTLVATGTLVSGVVATLAVTEAGDAVTATATLALSALLAQTDAGDSVSATATVSGGAVTGSLAVTEVGDSVAAQVSIFIAAQLAAVESGDVLAGVATLPGNTLDLIYKILANRQELNPATGKFVLYDNDGITVLYQSNAWADAAGTIPYSGGALARIDALV